MMTKSSAAEGESQAENSRSGVPLHIVDLGKAKRKKIKQLKQGCGPLIDDVAEALAEVEAKLGSDATGKVLVPIVVVVERKSKPQRGLLSW